MLEHHNLFGELKIGQHKTIHCAVQLQVTTINDDEWGDPNEIIDHTEFVDGVRVVGELSFDTSPIESLEYFPIQKSVVAELCLRDDEGLTTKINILFVERSAIVDVNPKHVKRYFWQFYAIGKPIWDKIGIFPTNYRGKNMNRIYFCTDFRGYWPVGVASVVVAADKKEAKRILDAKLRESNIPIEGDGKYTLTEIDIQTKGAAILNDGSYR
jgi:hypothetical protein